eukprot:429380-Amphidinium_carterae.1
MEIDATALQVMRNVVGPKDDWYHWCHQSGMYISQDELLALMDDPLRTVIVVDTRDDDVKGGMIRGALHAADSTFDDVGLRSLLARVDCALREPVHIVFHCMESARRGPRCARRLSTYLGATTNDTSRISVCILEGGADQWIRRFHGDPGR